MKKAIIAGQSYEIEQGSDSIRVNGKSFELDIASYVPNTFHLLKDHQSYHAKVLYVDKPNYKVALTLNGKLLVVEIKNELALLLEQMGMVSLSGSVEKEIKAPMPGLVIDILVVENQEVKKGDQLLILEAMKMENVIKSPSDGVIATLCVSKGDSVEKGKILLSL